jgi:hypothetical protein
MMAWDQFPPTGRERATKVKTISSTATGIYKSSYTQICNISVEAKVNLYSFILYVHNMKANRNYNALCPTTQLSPTDTNSFFLFEKLLIVFLDL